MKIVIALGGNAIIKKGEKQTYSNLINNIKKTCKQIVPVLKKNKVLITHGNGSEIGYLAIQNEIAKQKVPAMPLDVLGAESQALIGYIIEEPVIKDLIKHNFIVIAVGGGGIPVYLKNNKLYGTEAVIDKDLASQVLANDIEADLLLILTGVPYVYLNYLKKKINLQKEA